MVKAPVARRRKWIALAVAGLVDAIQLGFFPIFGEGAASPFEVALDAAAALAILLILGFRWQLLFALVTELIPGVDLFPTWTAAVLSVPAEPKALPPPVHQGQLEEGKQEGGKTGRADG